VNVCVCVRVCVCVLMHVQYCEYVCRLKFVCSTAQADLNGRDGYLTLFLCKHLCSLYDLKTVPSPNWCLVAIHASQLARTL